MSPITIKRDCISRTFALPSPHLVQIVLTVDPEPPEVSDDMCVIQMTGCTKQKRIS